MFIRLIDMMFDSDSLTYGVVVTRLNDGDWWHGHIVRSDLEYFSEVLGRRTNLLFLMVRFGCGATRKSADFFLTLDAAGLPEECLPSQINGDWGERDGDDELMLAGSHIQENVLPLLWDSDDFQAAMAFVVHNQVHKKLADPKPFIRTGGGQ